MTGRIVQGLPKAIDIAGLSFGSHPVKAPKPRRRTLAAFLTGAGLLALGFCSLEAGVAAGLVNSSNSPISFITSQVHNRFSALEGVPAAVSNVVLMPLEPRVRHKRNGVVVASAAENSSSLPRHSVCVRLCDGYYFPIGPLSRAGDLPNQEAACSGLCPDAPTQLFVEPAGSDKIEDAVSSNGARYTALPVAFRNRATVDNTCSCHRRPGETFSLLNDSTLRQGDSIMTPSGIVVFRGNGHMPYAQGDFTNLANASMPRDKRETLAAIERAALPGLRQSSVAPTPPRKSQIAFAAPSPDRLKATPANKSIRFVEPMISASN
ncbi:DUF2865 domain-containing protein [Methylocapsa sp. S129]|uniref:DUF2865 domain-containing protein n=1 Tax=Methylocapsa sp. S129 TaxID=1641869 RepID=UPI00131BC231|nr:DUF2865 domain-containing protein [Methylocapsa sp. S129]